MKDLRFGDVSVLLDAHVGFVEIHRPPHNHFDPQLIQDLAEAFDSLNNDPRCRVAVLASEGKSFCAGADFSRRAKDSEPEAPLGSVAGQIYQQAIRLFEFEKPIVAAVQGAAVGGGLGLALLADFRVASPEARFVANFVKLGIHPGFGLTLTLPRLIGVQRASLMFYTGRRMGGEMAVAWGLADVLSTAETLRDDTRRLAVEIAEGAPLALQSTRSTMRHGLVEEIKRQTDIELAEQVRLMQTEDHREGVRAVSERRPANFIGR